MNFLSVDVIFVLIVNCYIESTMLSMHTDTTLCDKACQCLAADFINGESCQGQFRNIYTSKYHTAYLYCTTGCCGSYTNRYCCSKDQSIYKEGLSSGEIFGISFGVITGSIIFFGGFICVCKLCVMPAIRQIRRENDSGTDMHNTRRSDDIAVISASDALPLYRDLPPSYEEVMSGTINFSFLDDPSLTPTDNQQTLDIQQTAS